MQLAGGIAATFIIIIIIIKDYVAAIGGLSSHVLA